MKLQISRNLHLPAEATTQTFAILAKRGVGKTYTASVMVEEMLKADLPVVVADPIGVWWGLRSAADGKSPGLPIIVFGGEYADVPLEVAAGEIVARTIVEERLSAVLDLSRFRKGRSRPLTLMPIRQEAYADGFTAGIAAEWERISGALIPPSGMKSLAAPSLQSHRPPAPNPLPPKPPNPQRPRLPVNGDVGSGAMRLLKALAQRHPLKVSKAQLATLAGLSPRGGTYNTYLSRIRTAGFLEEQNGLISVSPAGLSAADTIPAAPQTTHELVEMWKSNVGGGAAKLLDILVAAYPECVARDLLAEQAGLAARGGTFNTYLSRLRSNGLVVADAGEVRAHSSLFEL